LITITGIDDHVRPEPVITFHRIERSSSTGIRDHFRPEHAVADDADLEEVYDSERHLLYVACTRARDHLLVTGVKPASEFLDDLLN
jgi:ATP-dependent exoDNAse (exonuclease V) beta subunit